MSNDERVEKLAKWLREKWLASEVSIAWEALARALLADPGLVAPEPEEGAKLYRLPVDVNYRGGAACNAFAYSGGTFESYRGVDASDEKRIIVEFWATKPVPAVVETVQGKVAQP